MPRRRPSSTSVISSTLLLAALLIAGVVYSALWGGGPLLSVSGTAGPTPAGGGPSSEGPFRVYFTDPASPEADSLRGGPDEALVEAVKEARFAIDLAAYDLDLWSLRDALLDAQQRGVNVRLVAESDNLDEPEMQELIDAGIPVLGDRREGLMHNKFAIIDRHQVWTGSMNYTVRGAYRNNNNLISVESPQVAQDYLAEFDEMFVDDQFGPGSPANTPFQALELDGRRLEVYFSPDDGTQVRLHDLLREAQESIYFLAFSFTSDELAQVILDRSRAGVEVAGVFEESQASGQGAEYGPMRSAGLDVRLDGNPANMHHKVIIIDRRIVITGSYNFSASAERRNDENTLIIFDPRLAGAFLDEFARVYEAALP